LRWKAEKPEDTDGRDRAVPGRTSEKSKEAERATRSPPLPDEETIRKDEEGKT
jgi:hypothetical protein